MWNRLVSVILVVGYAIVAGSQIAGGLLVPYVRRLFTRRTQAIILATILSVLMLVAIGMTTHLILDCLMDVIGGDHAHFGPGAAIITDAWPLLGHFASVHFASVPEHLESLLTVPIVVSEIVGLGLLMWEWRRTARRAAIDERR